MSKEMKLERLLELREEMEENIREVESIMRKEFRGEYINAEVYWIAHIKNALGGMGYHTHSTTFQSALESLEEEVYEREEDEFED